MRMTLGLVSPRVIFSTVGIAGFEPTTPRSQSECATKLRHIPIHKTLAPLKEVLALLRALLYVHREGNTKQQFRGLWHTISRTNSTGTGNGQARACSTYRYSGPLSRRRSVTSPVNVAPTVTAVPYVGSASNEVGIALSGT